MKTIKKKTISLGLTAMMLLIACNDSWDEHYVESKIETSKSLVYDGSIAEYIQQEESLAALAKLFKGANAFADMSEKGGYTVIVCDNEKMAEAVLSDTVAFVNNSISDIAVPPSKLKEGMGLYTRNNKNVWVYEKADGIYLDNYRITTMVKVKNGYVYWIAGALDSRFSVYAYLHSLGNDYSLFKEMVQAYEESYFDAKSSTPDGVDEMGNTTYSDSVTAIRNTLMDRYTQEGLPTWNMRSEGYNTTLFVPNNQVVTQALKAALDSIPVWLNRRPTVSDTLKFKEWIVKACFVNRRLLPEEVSISCADIDCVGNYVEKINKSQDTKEYVEMEPALWRPSVQKVDAQHPVPLSNGIAYQVNELKIPNHVVIYRVKTKFYQIWSIMNADKKEKYFRWLHWTDPQILNDAQTEFTLSETMPTMYYHVLTAVPDEEALNDRLKCSVTYDGLLYNTETKKLVEAHLPAGEYYLRMGFKHSLTYSISIYFNGKLLVEDMCLSAQGSNYHFDRGGASSMEYFGSMSIGYPEGFDWRYWYEQDGKSVAYDTDGYTVALVNLPKNGNFTITVESSDMSSIYDAANGRSKNNLTQLMMYHWCLRPTRNNY